MQRYELVRYAETDGSTLGRLGSWYTLELPNRHNWPNVSCIPAGIYVCRRRMYHHGGYPTFEVCDVPGRSDILIHVANFPEDLRGCIGIGLGLGVLQREGRSHIAITSSRKGHSDFMDALKHTDAFELEIREH